MNSKLKYLIRFLAFFIIFYSTTATSQNSKLKVLVIVNGENDLKVDLNNTAFTGGGLLGVFISQSIQNKTNDEKSRRLNDLLPEFKDYKFKHVESIKENYEKLNQSLDVTAFNKKDVIKYFKDDSNLNFDMLKKDNWNSVILIEEVLGFFRENIAEDKFLISLSSVVKAYDVEKKKSVEKMVLTNKNPKRLYTIDEIFTDKTILMENYTSLYPNTDNTTYNRLLGRDVFHNFSKSQNLENAFPSVRKKIKEYAKKFELKFPEIPKWSSYNTFSDFYFINAPRKDKMTIAVATTIDLAIEELGQKDMTLEEFSANNLSKLSNANFEIDTKTELPKLNVKSNHISYMVSLTKGGKSIFIDLKVDEYFISNEIILNHEDYTTLFNKYKLDIEQFINETYLIKKAVPIN